VLGVLEGADDAEIRRAKRTLSLATHPDKIGEAPGASTAFNLVTEVGLDGWMHAVCWRVLGAVDGAGVGIAALLGLRNEQQ
jgi:hypothetical protein